MFRNMITAFAEAIERRVVAKRTYEELSRLTDRELEDIGLTRWDINNVAAEAGRAASRTAREAVATQPAGQALAA